MEAVTVVGAAAVADRLLFEFAPAGRGLPGVEETRAGALERLDVAAGEGGDAREG
jgi:hypothetical protein